VSNRPGEAFYIHDLDSGSTFSPLACVLRGDATAYEARHERGLSRFIAKANGLHMELAQLVDPVDPVKAQRLTLRNDGTTPLRLRVYGYVEWVLGNDRARSAAQIVPAYD